MIPHIDSCRALLVFNVALGYRLASYNRVDIPKHGLVLLGTSQGLVLAIIAHVVTPTHLAARSGTFTRCLGPLLDRLDKVVSVDGGVLARVHNDLVVASVLKFG